MAHFKKIKKKQKTILCLNSLTNQAVKTSQTTCNIQRDHLISAQGRYSCCDWANPGLLFVYFRSFQTNNTIFNTNPCEKCHVHPVYRARIRTHDLLNMSHIPLNQGYRLNLFITFVAGFFVESIFILFLHFVSGFLC